MREKRWMLHTKRAPFQEIAVRFGIDQVTARIIRNREICTDEAIEKFLNGTLTELYDPCLLRGAAEAAQLISQKIREHSRIRIIGDYDIDGICAVMILYTVLRKLGAQVDYAVPERMRDGYGLNIRLIEDAFGDGIDTLLTCDNGIGAIEQIAYAKKLQMTVIVTDHHRPVSRSDKESDVYVYPPADVLVDPHLAGETFPFHDICGAVVAWKVMEVLMDDAVKKRTLSAEARKILYTECLQFAAIATVGDVMPLIDENRIIVKYGLAEMAHTSNIGLRALMDAAEIQPPVKSHDIGFVIGPCINAVGRLETAVPALDLFNETSETKARELALHLKTLNEERKEITNQGLENAITQIEQGPLLYDKVLVVYLPDTHESVAGIIAGKIKELYHRPTFVITNSKTPGIVKGSGRSIKEYVMHEGLMKCSHLLDKFGGHPMAAGVTLRADRLDAFRRKLNEDCTLTEEELTEKIMIDVPMPIGYVSTSLIHELSKLEPFGTENPKPIFAEKDVSLHHLQIFGKNKNVLRIKMMGDRNVMMDGVIFGAEEIELFLEYLRMKYSAAAVQQLFENSRAYPLRLSIVYEPRINVYMDCESIQIRIKDYK